MSQVSSQITPANSWAMRMADSLLARYPLSRARWHYEHGLVVKAIADVGAVTGEARFTRFAGDWADHFVTPDGHIRTYRVEEFNLDQVYPGRLLFASWRRSGEERYARAIQLIHEQLRRQPRTQNGGFWHKQIYPYQVWLDGLYMAGPFYAEYALTFDEPEGLGDVTRQLLQIEQHVRDPRTGLLYHGWDESRTQKWADPLTGCSPHFWGRAIGWYAMALVDVLDLLPRDQADRPELIAILLRLAAALVRVQDPSTGLWYQVLDLADRPGNYLESSVSAMLAYAFARAVRRGYLPADYFPPAQRAYRGLLENRIKIDAGGLLNLEGTCSVAGLGGRPYRDGSFEYYVSEKTGLNDFKGVGPFILAALEMESAGVETGHGA
jgi:unsaturated rhamnogalacturonyl hydrolase